MSASHPTSHERDRDLLSAYLDGELNDKDRTALERRLIQENALRADLEALRDTVRLLRGLPVLKAPRDFTLDPAVYERSQAWWKRLLVPATVFQVSGALGAAASVILIVVALTINGGDLTNPSVRDKNSAESVAVQATTTLAPAAAEEQSTAIAYSGEGLLQSTLAMQATVYAGTPAASPPVAAFAAAPLIASTGTPASETETLESAPAQDAAVEPYAAGQAEQPAEGVAVGEAQQVPEAAAVSPQVTPAPSVAQNLAAATPSPQHDETAQGAASASQLDNALRDSTSAGTPTPPTESVGLADTSAPITPTPAAIAAADQTGSETNETDDTGAAQSKTAAQEKTERTWWLVGVGALTLALSGGLLVIGRRKARRL